MKVKIFDLESEKDLEGEINEFLSSKDMDVTDIKYQVSSFGMGEEQIYFFLLWLYIVLKVLNLEIC